MPTMLPSSRVRPFMIAGSSTSHQVPGPGVSHRPHIAALREVPRHRRWHCTNATRDCKREKDACARRNCRDRLLGKRSGWHTQTRLSVSSRRGERIEASTGNTWIQEASPYPVHKPDPRGDTGRACARWRAIGLWRAQLLSARHRWSRRDRGRIWPGHRPPPGCPGPRNR